MSDLTIEFTITEPLLDAQLHYAYIARWALEVLLSMTLSDKDRKKAEADLATCKLDIHNLRLQIQERDNPSQMSLL